MTPDIDTAAKNGAQNRVCILEGGAAVERRGNPCGIVAALDDGLDGAVGEVETLFVDVKKRDVRVFHEGKGEQVAHQTACELKAAGADKGDFCHVLTLVVRFPGWRQTRRARR